MTGEHEELFKALHWLDQVLERAVAGARLAYGQQAGADPYRGLYVTAEDADRIIKAEQSAHTPAVEPAPAPGPSPTPRRRWNILGGSRSGSTTATTGTPPAGSFPAPASDLDLAAELISQQAAAISPRRLKLGQEPIDFPDLTGEGTSFGWLADSFGLTDFHLQTLILALAPEVDLRYERLFAYLQDDVTRKRPTVELVLDLLCEGQEQRLECREAFGAESVLVREHLISLVPDPHQVQPPLLAHYVRLENPVLRLLVGDNGLDPRLASFCRLVEPQDGLERVDLPTRYKVGLAGLAAHSRKDSQPLRLYLQGPASPAKLALAQGLAASCEASLLIADLSRALNSADFDLLLALLWREAWFQDALLFLDDFDSIRSPEHLLQYQSLLDALTRDQGIALLSGTQPWAPPENVSTGVVVVPFARPGFAERMTRWQQELAERGLALAADDVYALADRYRLTSEQIADSVTAAHAEIALREAAGEDSPADEMQRQFFFSAARQQSGHELARLARKVDPIYDLDDIVLPPPRLDPDHTREQLEEICRRVAHRQRVLDDWGFATKLAYGRGVTVLFAGPPGTGKTMAAQAIARRLQLDLYEIDLSQVVSKYIGETEKNLDRIFTTAQNSNAILLFNEADALFGKRSEVRDSHDRYANIEIAYLLQKMEEYEGLAILATNLRQNLDDAFVRRLAFIVHFPFPDEFSRRRIWEQIWPERILLASDVDLDLLAKELKVSGGSIKNIALAAAFLAAGVDGPVTMAHLLQATERELDKTGRSVPEVEWTRREPARAA